MTQEELHVLLAPWRQEHLLRFWDDLDQPGRRRLARQIEEIDFPLIQRLLARHGQQANVRALADRAEPPPGFRLGSPLCRFSPEEAAERGRAALDAGEVGVLIVAGGQGTRLGFDHPKGMYRIGPVSKRSLFQIHAEKVLARSRRHGAPLPLYLMTSPATHGETVAFLAENDRFGLAEDDLRIVCQGTMPAVEAATGRVLLEAPDRIALSPDGHGGAVAALRRSGLLEEMSRRGIRHLFYAQVDNPLVDIGSPEFLGYHLLSRSEMSSQVIAKRDPLDRLGNVIMVEGRMRVIEYSDLPEDVARQREPDGSLRIWAGSIAVHAIDVALLERMADRPEALPFHVAHKKVAHVDVAASRFPPPTVTPQEANAIKFERFIFDLTPSAENPVVVEIDPADGFAPLKNAPGAEQDTPEAVRAAMIAQHRRWLFAAGAVVPDDVPVEISPLWALDADEVRQKVARGTRVTEATYFC